MKTIAKIIQGKYLDSVKLMLISRKLREVPGVEDAVAIMATEENKGILAATGMLVDEILPAKDNDIVLVIKGEGDPEAWLSLAEDLLSGKNDKHSGTVKEVASASLESAINHLEHPDICLISVAGKYAAAEADKALDRGLHVMLFSDNVSLEAEFRLKQKAISRGLLMMGPDCGTAILNGVPLAFANAVPRGKIGIVSASGTGLQEVSVAIAHQGFGISQAFGTGGRDGKEEIGGIMLHACLDHLIHDPETEVIVLIAKTPEPKVLEKLWDQIASTPKKVIVNFLKPMETPNLPNIEYCHYLDETAAKACLALSESSPYPLSIPSLSSYVRHRMIEGRKGAVKGLYSGGTLCKEAALIYTETFGKEPLSNLVKDGPNRVKDIWNTDQDCFIDLGEDEFTVGRPHPMIDFSLRAKLIANEGKNPTTTVILLDVVLGWGAHPDPAAELVPVLKALPERIKVVCHVLGTDADPQQASKQKAALEAVGVKVFSSNHEAVDHALAILAEGGEES